MRRILSIGLIALTMLMSACDQGAQFMAMPTHLQAGLGGRSLVSLTPTPTPEPPVTGEENRTVIQLLTPTIINNAAKQFLQFQVSYEGPSGNPVDFPFDQMLFDIASVNLGEIRALEYTITVSNSVEYQGEMDPHWGEDLFGNVGSNFFHYATDQWLNIPAGVRWFIFSIDLSYTTNHPYGSSGTPPPQEVIQVYVKFGHDSLLASAPVTFINQ